MATGTFMTTRELRAQLPAGWDGWMSTRPDARGILGEPGSWFYVARDQGGRRLEHEDAAEVIRLARSAADEDLELASRTWPPVVGDEP